MLLSSVNVRHLVGYPVTAVLALSLGAACNSSPQSEPKALATAPRQVNVPPQASSQQTPAPTAAATARPKPQATARPTAEPTAKPKPRPTPPQSPKPAATAKPKPASSCDPNYSGCVPIASDVDCAGGSGNGPKYVRGPVRVKGSDIYGLDSDSDGVGCE